MGKNNHDFRGIYLKKIVCFLVMIFIILPIFTTTTEATATTEVKKTQITAPLRASASPKAKVISTLPKGTLVIQISTVKGGWTHIQVNDKKGYVATNTLTAANSTVNIVNSKNGLVIKESASTKSKTVATLKQQMIIEDFGKVVSRWHLVRYGSFVGYVDSKLIVASKPTKKYTNVNVTLRETANTSGKKTGSLNKNTEVSVHSQLSNWSYITSGSLKGYVPSNQLTGKKQNVAPKILKTVMELRPTKIKWMKYYFEGTVTQGNIEKDVYDPNMYVYTLPFIVMDFSPNGFSMGKAETEYTLADINLPLVQDKPTPFYEYIYDLNKDVQIGNSYLRSTNETITTPAGTFKNVVHVEDKYKNLPYTMHFYFAPGYGLVKAIDSKKHLKFELRSYK